MREDTRETGRGERERSRSPLGRVELAGSCWWNEVSEDCWMAGNASYWHEDMAAVTVEIDMPESHRAWKNAMVDLESYFVGAIKRKAVEVSEKRLTGPEREGFRDAKMVEVRNFLAAQAFEALPEHLRPSREQAIGMRWVLTWKIKDDGTRRPKARAVLLGYQDPA